MSEAVVTRNGTTQSYQYAYDPFGRRISKTDAFNTTHFIWDGNRLLSETRGNQTKTYLYEQDGFVPVAQLDNDAIQYYHTDHLGTPRELTNPKGEIVWEETYTTWGNTVQKSWQPVRTQANMELQAQPLRFQGQYFDTETGLHYNRFRYYDPDIGRFVTQDPIGTLGGVNLYQYVDNPLNWIDPLGLARIPVSVKKKALDENKEFFGEHKCEKCSCSLVKPKKSERGVTPPQNEWQLDHIEPDSLGGANTEDNVQVLCRKCNRQKSNKDDTNYKEINRDNTETEKETDCL